MSLQVMAVAMIFSNLGIIGQVGSSEKTQTFGEYCQWEVFEPQCDGADVIIMQSALYGRMRIGRCVEAEGRLIDVMQRDPLYLGCSANVLPIVDSKCSGQPRCYLKVADFRSTRPCYVGLEMYLEASYSCARVIEYERSCTVTVSGDPVHISLTQVPTAVHCGTHSKPWRFEVSPGEHLRLNLLQFKQSTDTELFQQDEPDSGLVRYSTDDETCLPVGYLKEAPADVRNPICAGRNKRHTFLYESSANAVDLVLTLENQLMANSLKIGRVFISFEVVGCPDLQPAPDAWMKRNGSEAIFGCFETHHTWHLECQDRQWSGVTGNCTQQTILADIGRAEDEEHFIKQVLFMVILVGSCLAVFLTALCIGTIVFQRREKSKYLKNERAKCAAELSCPYGTMHRVAVEAKRSNPTRTRTILIQNGEFRSRTVRPSDMTLTSTNEIYFRTLPAFTAFAENNIISVVQQRTFDTFDNDDNDVNF